MLDKLIAFLFAIGVIVIPFDAIAGVNAIGELSNEASFYSFALAMSLYGLKAAGASLVGCSHAPLGAAYVQWTGAVVIAVICVSALWNGTDISVARFHDRGGFLKLVTSAAVLIYGLVLAWLTCATVPGRWYRCLILPICISAVLCLSFGALEALDRAGVSVPMYSTLNSAIHSGSDLEVLPWDSVLNVKLVDGWDKRLRTVSFEPPAFGNFAGLAWPWLVCAVLMTRKSRRALHVILLLAFTILIVGSQARTGWLLLGANLVSFGLLRFLFLPRDGQVNKPAALIAGSILLLAGATIIVIYTARFDGILADVINGTSTSDLSRLAYQVTALKIFAANPIVGVGLGQFAFNAAASMPSWGFLSPEIRPSLLYPEAPWPNTYSLYARLAAELGVIGLLGWATLWSGLIISVCQAARTYAGFHRPVPVIAYAIIMSCIGVLVSGVTTDTFRTPIIGITLGAGACFIARSKQLARERVRDHVLVCSEPGRGRFV
jgi:hypothetical protein